MLYTDKSKEELEAILDLYIKIFNEIFQKSFNKDTFKQQIIDLIEQKKKDRFNSVFETLTPHSLYKILDLMESQKASPENQVKTRKVKDTIPSNPIMTKK